MRSWRREGHCDTLSEFGRVGFLAERRVSVGAFATIRKRSSRTAGIRSMKTFHCTHCQNLIFFENVRCLSCDHSLAFLPDRGDHGCAHQSPDGLVAVGNARRRRRIRGIGCARTMIKSACATGRYLPTIPQRLCKSCRLNRVIPDLSDPEQQDRLVPLGARQAPHDLHADWASGCRSCRRTAIAIPDWRSSFWRTPPTAMPAAS